MPSVPWKEAERRLARLFGATRRPLSGRNSKSGGSDDAIHDNLYLEAKWRKRQALWSLYREVAEAAKREGKIPVLGIAEKASKGILLVFNSEDFGKVIAEYLLACQKENNQYHRHTCVTCGQDIT